MLHSTKPLELGGAGVIPFYFRGEEYHRATSGAARNMRRDPRLAGGAYAAFL